MSFVEEVELPSVFPWRSVVDAISVDLADVRCAVDES